MVSTEQDLTGFLNEIQRAFLALDMESLLRVHRFPLPVYTVAGVLIIRSEEELMQRARAYREHLSEADHSTLKIVERSEPRNGRFTVTAQWNDYDLKENPVAETIVRYFLVEDADDRWKVEMLEYIQEPLPLDAVNRIIH